MLQHAKGNLIDMAEAGMFDIIVHGCNCQNTMGSGIAKEIRERYPEVYAEDWRWGDREGRAVYSNPANTRNTIWKLGNYTVTNAGPTLSEFKIVNAYTQLHYLPRGMDHFEYESFRLILRKLSVIYPDKHFGLPYIGMGLAGGDETRIIKMIIDFANDVTDTGGSVTLVEFSG